MTRAWHTLAFRALRFLRIVAFLDAAHAALAASQQDAILFDGAWPLCDLLRGGLLLLLLLPCIDKRRLGGVVVDIDDYQVDLLLRGRALRELVLLHDDARRLL